MMLFMVVDQPWERYAPSLASHTSSEGIILSHEATKQA